MDNSLNSLINENENEIKNYFQELFNEAHKIYLYNSNSNRIPELLNYLEQLFETESEIINDIKNIKSEINSINVLIEQAKAIRTNLL